MCAMSRETGLGMAVSLAWCLVSNHGPGWPASHGEGMELLTARDRYRA